MVYSGLVPMSPNTTPIAPSISLPKGAAGWVWDGSGEVAAMGISGRDG